ncbi:SpoIIE family protein phosphatase [Nonomuraea sp. M3C6]|uniref:SpoIIE family protein phosphatase n=1 Tax=Nonomuraea marmarensis TaxID=3351344 RepID=A0ABW7AT04_9ACTN
MGVDMAASDATGGGAAKAVIPAVAMIDAEGTVIGWTQAAEDLLGYRAADVLGRSGAVLLKPDDREARISAWVRKFGHLDHWIGVAEARHRDGSALLLRLEGSRLRTSQGTAVWLLSAMTAGAEDSAKSVMEPLINRSPVAMWMWDRELRCVWRNERAQYLRKLLQAGGPLEESASGFDAEDLRAAMRQVLSDGAPVIDREFHWTTADQGEDRTFSISLFRLDSSLDGRPTGVLALALDITQSRARQRLTLLIEAGARIGGTLDVKKTAQALADVAVPVLADYVSVDLAGAVLQDDEPLHRLAATEVGIPVFRRAGLASIHEGIPEALWRLGDPVFVAPSSPFTEVLSSGRSHFEPVLDTSPGRWLDRQRLKIINETRMHSLIIVPLRARGDILGITVFVRTDNPVPFARDDLALAEELAGRAALRLDNARRYTRERTAALALQRHLLPHDLSGGGAVEVAWRYLPSGIHDGVGGDWFDAIPLPDGRIALVVGDVTGHGINAAARMGRMRIAVRTLTYVGLPPDQLLAHLDLLVARMGEPDAGADGLDHDVIAATCVYVVYDPATRRCTMAAAGHPPPALVDPAGGVGFPRLPSGTPIGLGLGSYESLELELAEGTLIVLYTDGLIETREADIDAGLERLRAALSQATLPLEQLCTTVIDTMVGGTTAEDDVALLMARTRVSNPSVPPSRRRSWRRWK